MRLQPAALARWWSSGCRAPGLASQTTSLCRDHGTGVFGVGHPEPPTIPKHHAEARLDGQATGATPHTGLSFPHPELFCHGELGTLPKRPPAPRANTWAANVSQYCLQSNLGSSTVVPI